MREREKEIQNEWRRTTNGGDEQRADLDNEQQTRGEGENNSDRRLTTGIDRREGDHEQITSRKGAATNRLQQGRERPQGREREIGEVRTDFFASFLPPLVFGEQLSNMMCC